ncbi:FG-GAP-like repeat-containing protein [Saccharomonospora piscinae]|uniref:FG-GAP-like repeat-containing protein n=1 Tax=Saccharomonospora piscinae TaxID=687388 RepID=UPI001ABDE746|nr:FG-GAP-like repeat-containing protein [Saccharomonospora piscinae]
MSRSRGRPRTTALTTLTATTALALTGLAPATAQAAPATPDLPPPPPGLERLDYHRDDLTVDLGVGLWAWPLPMDVDGDGVHDLLVNSPDKPYNGLWYFHNTGTNDEPLFAEPERVGNGRQNTHLSVVDGEPVVTTPGQRYPDVTESGFAAPVSLGFDGTVHEPDLPDGRLRGDQWYLVDFTGDGDLDIVAGIGDWSEYGWDAAYDDEGNWTNGPLHGYVYLIENEGTTEQPVYADPVKVEAGDEPIDVYGAPTPVVADFDGDGALDIVTGEFLDTPHFFGNVGTRTEPEYAEGRPLPLAGGGELRLDLQMIIVTTVDWNTDGHPDLVIGEEDGRVALVENTGTVSDDGLPVFEPPRYFQQRAGSVKVGALTTPSSVDWNGDGREDLIAGDTAGRLNFVENLGGDTTTPSWAPPVRLRAGGEEIRHQAGENGSIQGPAEAKWGYTAPVAADWNHDGLPDLLVNDIWGKVVWYENVGTRTEPALAAAQPIEVAWEGDAPAPAWNWWEPEGDELVTQWRTTPFAIDLDQDGLQDLVSLDHEGYLAFFERVETDDGLRLLPGERIFVGEAGSSRFEGGNGDVVDAPKGPLQLNSSENGQSGRRKFTMVDWTQDGKLDIVINGTNAQLLENVGTDDEPWLFRLAGDIANGQLAGHTTSPTVVNWDGDDTPDLLIGAEDGRFYHQPWNHDAQLPERRPDAPENPGELIGAWSLDEGSGHVAADRSGHGNHGIVDGARWVDGHRGSGLRFDAFNDYVDLSYQLGPHLDGARGITVSGWVRPDSLDNGTQRIFGTRINGGTAGVEVTFQNTRGQARIAVAGRSESPGDGYRKHVFDTPSIKAGQWHHVAAVMDYEADAVRLYVDGVARSAPDPDKRFGSDHYRYAGATQPDSLGRSPDGGAYYRGSLDDVSVHRVALDQRRVIVDMLTAEVDRYRTDGELGPIGTPLARHLDNARRHLDAGRTAEARERIATAHGQLADGAGNPAAQIRERLLPVFEEYLLRADPPAATACDDGAEGDWTGSWRSAPAAPRDSNSAAEAGFEDETLRMVARAAAGGCDVRVRLSNEFGDQPVTFGPVTVAEHAGDGHLAPGTARPVTFGGESSVSVPPGEEAVSDPVGMAVGDRTELAVSLHVDGPTGPATTHNLRRETGYVADGEHTGDERADAFAALGRSWMYLSGIDVRRPDGGAVVVTGDSLTDGLGSTVGAEHTWPDELADRLLLTGSDVSVLNRGVSASRLLADAAPSEPDPMSIPGGLTRLDRDVDDAGVDTVILYLGINDIIQGERAGEPVTAGELIDGYERYLDRARAHGARVLGATLTPYGSSINWTESGERVRQEVNDWIRGSGAFDAVVDLDAAVRDADDPRRIDPRYDYRDGLHFNDLGHAAMADAVKLDALAG